MLFFAHFSLCIFVVQIRRKTSRIRASQPIFLQLILLGGALLFVSCVLQLERASSEFVCHSVLWTRNFGLGFFFVPLLLKTYRLHAVFEGAKHLKRIQIKTSTLIIALCAWLLLVEGIVSLLESTLLDQSPSYVYVPDIIDSKLSGRSLHKHRICGPESKGFRSENGGEQVAVVASLIGIVLNMLLVLAGVIMAIRTRNISSKFSESTQLVMIMYNSFLFSTLVFVFSTLPNIGSPMFLVRTKSLLLGIGLTLNIIILFVPKFYNFGDQQMNSLGGGTKKKNNNGSSAASNNSGGGGGSGIDSSSDAGTTGNKNKTISTTNSQSNNTTEYTAAKQEDTNSSLSNDQSSGEKKNTVVEMVSMNDKLTAAAVVHY